MQTTKYLLKRSDMEFTAVPNINLRIVFTIAAMGILK